MSRQPAVYLKNRCFYVHGEPVFINSGEVHYFRMKYKDWEDRIKKAKEAGLNTISSYIPWRWHEPIQKQFCFNGSSDIKERNLIRFLELIQKHKLYFFPRIGPVSNAEMTREGLPDWLIEGHDEIRVKKQDGKNLPHPGLPSLMHPLFQDYVSVWYQKILTILDPFWITNGGNIFVVQLCNEVGMVNWCARTADYNPATTRIYQNYLQEKYKNDIAQLNLRYLTQYSSFDAIAQPEGLWDDHASLQYWDWSEFYREFYARYYQSLASRLRQRGIHLPLTVNVPQFWDYNMCARGDQGVMTTTQYKHFAKYTDDVILGGAYQMRRLDYENFHDSIVMTEMARMLTTDNAPISCAEMQVGGMNDRPRIYPSDVELNLKTTFGHGVNSINNYMFAAGINHYDVGCRGSYHEWQAPVASDGSKRSHFNTLKIFGTLAKCWGTRIAPLAVHHDVTIGFYPQYYETEYVHGEFVDHIIRVRDRFFFDGMLRLLQLAGYNFCMKNLDTISDDALIRIPVLWVFALDFMSEIVQRKITKYVKNGGTLILNPNIPTQSPDFKPCTHIANELGIHVKKKIFTTIVLVGKQDIFLDAFYPVSIYDVDGPYTTIAEVPEQGLCGFAKKVERGTVMVLGYGLTHYFDYHISHIDLIARMAGCHRFIQTGSYDVHAVWRGDEREGFLFISNFNDDVKSIRLQIGQNIRIAGGKPLMIPRRSSWILPVNQQWDDGLTIVYSTAEILQIRKIKNMYHIKIHAPRDHDFYMQFQGSHFKQIKINHQKPYWVKKSGHMIHIRHHIDIRGGMAEVCVKI